MLIPKGRPSEVTGATALGYLGPRMADLFIADTRGDLLESRHDVAAVVTDREGAVIASAGLHEDPIFWRSTAKPFQLWPLVERGGVERWQLTSQHLALACGSHNAEPMHRDVAADWLRLIGAAVSDLACGGHPSLSPRVAETMIREGLTPGPLESNCSGKHAAMLALAALEGWPMAGYQRLDHPVQGAIAESIARWSGLEAGALAWGVDGCAAAAVASPLAHLAIAWAHLGASTDPALGKVREAMLLHPELVAGTGRLDTLLMQGWSGRILVKVGAEGVFAAALPTLGWGVALKVLDGDMRAAGIALAAVLEQVTRHVGGNDFPLEALTQWRDPAIRNTRGETTGHTIVHGALRFT
jgi:L-asparaginase II